MSDVVRPVVCVTITMTIDLLVGATNVHEIKAIQTTNSKKSNKNNDYDGKTKNKLGLIINHQIATS